MLMQPYVRPLCFLLVALLLCPVAHAAELDAARIASAAGTEAKREADGVVRIGWTRNDVPVIVDGTPLPPAAGLGSWAAFLPTGDQAMVMGDTVVFQDEVDAAMDAAFRNGLDVTGLHNHFFYDTPKVFFMHIGGHGDPVVLAAGVKAVWDAIRSVRERQPLPASRFPGGPVAAGLLDTTAISNIVGEPAQVNGNVAKITVGRTGRMDGHAVGASMGLTTWAAFHGSDALVAIDGDFIMTAAEVRPVLEALRRAGLHIVALHNHMMGESPAFYFTHFWGKGKAVDLAHGFRNALDAQAAIGAVPQPATH